MHHSCIPANRKVGLYVADLELEVLKWKVNYGGWIRVLYLKTLSHREPQGMFFF